MYTKQELIKLWGNDTKRREFVTGFKNWGIWFKQPELGLAFCKFDLPDGSRIIVMEYWRKPNYWEQKEGANEYVISHKYYLQTGEYFDPSPTSESAISEHLKKLKAKLAEELKNNA